jgi:hypothetical protein
MSHLGSNIREVIRHLVTGKAITKTGIKFIMPSITRTEKAETLRDRNQFTSLDANQPLDIP